MLAVVAPPATDLEGEDGEPGAGSLRKLGIGLAALARGGVGCGGPPGDRREKGHVDGDLCALMPWEAVSDDLQAAPVCEGRANVQVPQENIGGDPHAALTFFVPRRVNSCQGQCFLRSGMFQAHA